MSTYVAQGLAYFLAHPSLWRMTICPVLLTVVVGMTTVIVLLAAAMYPQEQGLYDAGVPEGLAWVLAIMLCLVESFVVIMRATKSSWTTSADTRPASASAHPAVA
ncbi:hypothetical protein PRNP1_009723 [Phytophthora ramorum]